MPVWIANLYDDLLLWLPVFRAEFLALNWFAIVLIWLSLFIITGYFIKPLRITKKSTEIEHRADLLQMLASGVLLAFINVLLYLIIPQVILIWLWLTITPFALGLTTGILQFAFFREHRILENSLAIFSGNFYIEPGQTWLSGITRAVSRHVWEQPQTAIGHAAGQLLNFGGWISKVVFIEGITVMQGRIPFANGVAFGSFVLVTTRFSTRDDGNDITDKNSYLSVLIRHELGHSLQSRCCGPAYLYKYGIPSAMTQGWTEKDAEFRSDRHLLVDFGIVPIFSSYEKTYKKANAGIATYFLFMTASIAGLAWNGTPGLLGAYLLCAGIIATLNLGKSNSRIF